ncbi:MAG: DUF362 domain-containing protein [Candidatus Heimdallarchaeaceae archaeon]
MSDSDELKQLLVDPWLKSETIIIKPNWVSTELANFTDVKTLRMLLEALDSHFVVTESHIHNLIHAPEGRNITVGDKQVNMKWLLTGEGWKWLIENPSWDWFKKDGHWDEIKKYDKIFLDENGFTDLFKEFDVDYINVTDEVWSGRIADPTEVKTLVESRFKPVQIKKLYSMVPKKLYDLRGSTFISFAKIKMYASFTLKNLFGMIPDPARPWWHGLNESRIASSIVDINKIYHTLFNVYGICEALTIKSFSHPEGKFSLFLPRMKYNVSEGSGVVVFGRDLVSLDAILLNLTNGLILQSEKINQEPIYLAEEEFGSYNREFLEESKIKVGHWFLP